MSGQPAARVGDRHTCPMATPGTPPVPHVGGPILPPGSLVTLIGNQPAARIGDMATCVGPPDVIAKGAFPVPIGNMPAARMTDQTTHGGVITQGCLTVLIGLAGTTGNPMAGTAACQAASSGRSGNSPTQGYQNCGVESSRQLINQATGSNITELNLLNSSINSNLAEGTPGSPLNPLKDGTATTEQIAGILSSNGVLATSVPHSMGNIETALFQGRGVIVGVWRGNMPITQGVLPNMGGHAILITGAVYDDNGNITEYIINDTGTGQCGAHIPANSLNNALMGGLDHITTNNPIW